MENDVTKKLAAILENHIGTIQKQKRIVTKLMQDNESAKHKLQVNKQTTIKKNSPLYTGTDTPCEKNCLVVRHCFTRNKNKSKQLN